MIEPAKPEQISNKLIAMNGDDQNLETAESNKDAFHVRLDKVFFGPLDLLLQLVRDKELEIHVVSLTEVCDSYCQYVRQLKDVNIDEAADYLVIAATLLGIKSRSLLPQGEVDLDEDPFDPGEELVQQLLAYKELRKVCEMLRDKWDMRQGSYGAGGRWIGNAEKTEDENQEAAVDLSDLSIWDLLKSVTRLEEETGFMRPHQVRPSGKPLRVYVEELWHKLHKVGETSLKTLLAQEKTQKSDAAYYLVAMLELAKQQQIDIKQESAFADILVKHIGEGKLLQLDDIDDDFDRQHNEFNPEVGELLDDKPL
ncbi:MAG: ScpA family protein [Planctomycetota bacterium]|jgi:segregation and condensation protein A|nr:ScpA family protein [Planctomycetota bacterium]